MDVEIIVYSASGRDSYTLDASEWRAEVARLEANPNVTRVTARQVEDIVQYTYTRTAA